MSCDIRSVALNCDVWTDLLIGSWDYDLSGNAQNSLILLPVSLLSARIDVANHLVNPVRQNQDYIALDVVGFLNFGPHVGMSH